MMSSPLAFDLSRYPLVVLRVGRAYSNAQWNQMLQELIEIIQRGPFVVVVDMRNAAMPNALQRRSFINMYVEHDLLTRAHFLALGALGESVVIRRVITALNWLRPAPHPVQVFATYDAAEAWVLTLLPGPLRQAVPATKPKKG